MNMADNNILSTNPILDESLHRQWHQSSISSPSTLIIRARGLVLQSQAIVGSFPGYLGLSLLNVVGL
jgi:hypothetical protein